MASSAAARSVSLVLRRTVSVSVSPSSSSSSVSRLMVTARMAAQSCSLRTQSPSSRPVSQCLVPIARSVPGPITTAAATTFIKRPSVSSLSLSLSQSLGSLASVRRFASGSADHIIKVPSMGDSITEGTVIQWQKQPGDWVNEDDVLCVIETDKVSVDVRATGVSGVLKEQLAKKDATVAVGAPLVKLDTTATKPAGAAKSAAPSPAVGAPAAPKVTPAPAPAAPAAPKTGVPAPAPAAAAKPTPVATASGAQPLGLTISGTRTESRVPMSRMRLTVAKRLKDSQNTNSLLTTFNEIDMTNIIELRNKYKDAFEKKHGVKLGFMSAFVRAATVALQESPIVNAVIDGSDVLYRDYVDISVAVATPKGLVVPVIRNCENLSFAQIEKTIGEYGVQAKNGTLPLESMVGGTFTISNGGVYGSLFGTPIVNPPQSAILGMHGTFPRPVAVGNEIKIRQMMYVALTYDHRLIDGRDAVLFLRKIKDSVEDPARILLDV